MNKPKVTAWHGTQQKEVEVDASEGVRFTMDDGRWVEMMWRTGDQTISITCDGQLVLRPAASNTCRVESQR